MTVEVRKLATIRTPDAFREYAAGLGIALGLDEAVESGPESPLAQPYTFKDGTTVGNRWCIHPMEGWDATLDGKPTDLITRRWTRFGASGAKLIWCEASAVRHDGRANPHQLMITADTAESIGALREELVAAHVERFGDAEGLFAGLQLTHSGRFSRPDPDHKLKPAILYHHPLLDEKFGIDPALPVMTDGEIAELIAQFVESARLAGEAGFDFVDVKHCHGYLGHEFLSAYTRPGKYGGSFENRTRFLREAVGGIRAAAPGLKIGVRLSAFDIVPYVPDADNIGEPMMTDAANCPARFGGSPDDVIGIDLTETVRFLELLKELDIELVNITAGSPYYSHHVQRPTLYPPSDGYQPPEDPLIGVARQLNVTAQLKKTIPDLAYVGTAYTYLQEWLPNVAQHEVRTGRVDFVGIGRMALSYPDMPADVLAGKKLDRRKICRTFSDCTTAPRRGMVSGCYPLDDFYTAREEAVALGRRKPD